MIPVNAQQEEPSLSYVRAAWICPQQLSYRRLGLEIQKYLPSSSMTHRPVPGLFIHLGAPARLPGLHQAFGGGRAAASHERRSSLLLQHVSLLSVGLVRHFRSKEVLQFEIQIAADHKGHTCTR